ncbi:PqqD family protein [Roseofilum casamattae]|uniref:PqqD family protein n=1 Tax=Roseofilum casamattae BLCC-M143 TaxID=3022442 RepID=A0ABT7C060_9CYAN|nr:PqqD family protein [Roseofilum casamattae]MDJ1184129.1 PqqD family protein [Roseofilum casamattae BLCC-M143]
MLQFASDRKVSVAPDVMAQDLAGESVLLNLQTEEYFGLDDVGTRIWQNLTEKDSIQSAIDALLTEYDVEQEQLQHDVDTLIAELLDHGLVEVSPA